MDGLHLLGIFIVVFALLWGISIYRKGREGFETSDTPISHDSFNNNYQEKYNRLGAALISTKNESIMGDNTRGMLGSVVDTLDSDESAKEIIDNPYPLEGGRSGMFAKIDKCEAVKTMDCNAFDDSGFSETCGICLDIGTNYENKPVTGGLVITKNDRDYARSGRKSNFLPNYEPTVGTCPAGKFVTTKKECQRLKNQLDCAKNNSFNQPAGCAQCYNDSSYSIVNPGDPNFPNPDLISGYGTLWLYGQGKLRYKQGVETSFKKKRLSDKVPIKIQLSGPEFDNTIQLNVIADREPELYDDSIIYEPDDRIIFNDLVFVMVEGANAPGYNPARQGDLLWRKPGVLIEDFPLPEEAYIMGYITGRTATGTFNMDIYPLIISDSITGRKPRTQGPANRNSVDIMKITPGYGQKDLKLSLKPVFTFVDPLSSEASVCPSSPFITNPASATFMASDPCYTKGSQPGNYSLECLQNLFIINGCLNEGKGYPSDNAKAAGLLINGHEEPQSINDIANTIYGVAVLSATGVDTAGNKVTISDWSAASEFCSGRTITSPCDIDGRETGPLSVDCITYLWDNKGENKREGSTYSSNPNARSLFSIGKTNRFCTRAGLKSPKNASGVDNPAVISFWKKQGGVAAVKEKMKTIHITANNPSLTEAGKKEAMLQCYGLVPTSNTNSSFVSKWASDTSFDSGESRSPCDDATFAGLPACKVSSQINPGESFPACGSRVTIFAGPNFSRYVGSIPLGTFSTPDEVSRIPGNKGQIAIDGNCSLVFPSRCALKLTINNGTNFSGPVTYTFTKTCPESINSSTGACGQIMWDSRWNGPVQSIKLEIQPSTDVLLAEYNKAMSQFIPTTYSDKVIYLPGNSIIFNGYYYIMREGAGKEGYPPDRLDDLLWVRIQSAKEAIPEQYSNNKTYNAGSIVIFNTSVYVMNKYIGSPGYDPGTYGYNPETATQGVWALTKLNPPIPVPPPEPPSPIPPPPPPPPPGPGWNI